ncbi:hypothetical protein VTN77DRAFT_9051 [Rasamsonia byssochlamydoides]|uniref:uncharacterized protein n=1 Tax=Rasamsonia byssochlamydoides TaxID=89139 RepID=UPI003743B40B
MCGADVFLAVLAVFFPPISVWIKRGICTADSIINLALCCLGYIPGLLHSWYIILKYPDQDPDYPEHEGLTGSHRGDVEGGRVTYYYVSHQPAPHPGDRNYGAISTPQTVPPQVPSATRPAPQAPYPEADSSYAAPSDSRPPPTYAEAVRGDYKVQTQD